MALAPRTSTVPVLPLLATGAALATAVIALIDRRARNPVYHPSLFVAYGLEDVRDRSVSLLVPVGSGWPPLTAIELTIAAEPTLLAGGEISVKNPYVILVFKTDSIGSFGSSWTPSFSVPESESIRVVRTIPGGLPDWLPEMFFMARDPASGLVVFHPAAGASSVYFKFDT